MYHNKFDNIDDEYNDTYHSIIKLKPVDVKSSTYLNLLKKFMTKTLNLTLVKFLEYQDVEIVLPKAMFQIGWRSFCD